MKVFLVIVMFLFFVNLSGCSNQNPKKISLTSQDTFVQKGESLEFKVDSTGKWSYSITGCATLSGLTESNIGKIRIKAGQKCNSHITVKVWLEEDPSVSSSQIVHPIPNPIWQHVEDHPDILHYEDLRQGNFKSTLIAATEIQVCDVTVSKYKDGKVTERIYWILEALLYEAPALVKTGRKTINSYTITSYKVFKPFKVYVPKIEERYEFPACP